MAENNDTTTYATLEQGTTEWLARILEPDKAPAYFVPSGIYRDMAMPLKSVLCKALNDTYKYVVIVSEQKFNALVAEREAPDLFLEEDIALP